MDESRSTMGVSAQEPGLSRVRLKSPQHSSMLSSPTESDGTEFFDAQEEILWSPEPPSKLPPLPVHRESKAQQGQIADYDRKPQAADGGHSADHKRTMVKSIWSPVPIQGPKSGILVSLFPSRESMLRSEDKRFSRDFQAPSADYPPSPLHTAPRVGAGTEKTLVSVEHDAEGVQVWPPDGRSDRTTGKIPLEQRETSSTEGEDERVQDQCGDETSTASGTITEGGWESGHGLDVEQELMPESGKTVNGKPGVTLELPPIGDQSASPQLSARRTFRKVLESARSHHLKILAIRRRRAKDAGLKGVSSPHLGSGSDSGSGLGSGSRSRSGSGSGSGSISISISKSNSEAASPQQVRAADTPGSQTCIGNQCKSKGPSTGSLSRATGVLRRRKKRPVGAWKGGGSLDSDNDGLAKVKVQQHGRRCGAKEDSWKSMHLLQRLQYHKGPIWTVEFNRHGTLMATGGEDGKVMLWKVHAPGEGRHRDDHHEGNYRNEDEDEEDEKRNGQGDGEGDGDGTQPSREERSRERMDEELGESLEENVKEKEKHQESGDESGSRVSSSADQTGSESASSASALSDEVQSLGRGDSYLGASDESKGEGKEKEKGKGSGGRMFGRFKVFDSKPVRIFTGHRSDVVDLSWSHSDFICSASIDHTVMLWHPLREERLGTFTHPHFVTAVQFHPWDDHVFLSGCFDKKLRLWTIPEMRVVNWVQCQDMISAANFSPDGQLTVAGLYDGRVMFYHTLGLRYYTQIHCRNRHGSNRRGKKVSGLAFAETTRLRHHSQRCRGSLRDSAGGGGAAGGAAGLSQAGTACAITVGVGGAVGLMAPVAGVTGGFGDSRLLDGKASSMSAQYSLLATTNDSRLRVYDLDSFAMTNKFKGLVNDGMQIKASFSEDGKFVISGSEDGEVYIWRSTQRPRRRKCSSTIGAGAGAGAGAASAGTGAYGYSQHGRATGAAIRDSTHSATPAGRVKSRMSSSFGVQCAVRPQVATVARFLPQSALNVLLEGGECGSEGISLRLGDDLPGGSPTVNMDVEDTPRGIRWRHARGRRASAPVQSEASRVTKRSIDQPPGTRRTGRRRWSLVTRRLGGSGGTAMSKRCLESGKAASPSPDDGGASLPAGERHLRLSLSPRLDQKHSKWGASSWPPGASLSCRPRKDSEEHRFWGKSYYLPSGRQASATGSTVGEEGGDEEGDGEGHGAAALGSSGVGVRVVVTADYGGEVKVFLGLGDVS